MTESTEKLALVTGASRGLGAALALELSETHHVVAVARTTGALEELDDRIKAKGGAATLAPMDIANEAAMAQLCRSIYDRWGTVDLWAHTAIHAAPIGPAAQMEVKDFIKAMDINVTALARLITFVAPLLREDSQAVFFDDDYNGEKFFANYGTCKAAQMALVRSWQAESEKIGPRVHILSPGPMGTHTRARFYPGEDRKTLPHPIFEAKKLLRDLI
ncbi:MAG: SDR family oxidoreductase [Pseudomonadota bacterium]